MRRASLLAIPFVLVGGLSMASRVHYEDATLPNLVEEAELIVVARALEPIRTVIDVPLAGVSPESNKTPIPDFQAVVLHFEVVENLFVDRKAELPPKLDVVAETLGSQYSLHRKYYVEGISKSPIYRRYDPKGGAVNLEPGTQVILFLRWPLPKDAGVEANPLERALARPNPPFALVVDGAIERTSVKKAIRGLLAKRRPVDDR